MENRRPHHYLLKIFAQTYRLHSQIGAKYVIIPRFQARKHLMLLVLSGESDINKQLQSLQPQQ